MAGLPTTQAVEADLEAERALADGSTWETLEQLDKESDAAYEAFLDYVHQGARRSLRRLHARYVQQTSSSGLAEKPPTTKLSTLFTWSKKHEWQDRVAKFEQEWQRRDQAVWEARRTALRQADWEAGEALRELAASIMAQTPQFLKTTRRLVKGSGGQPDREVVTLAIQIDDLLKALKLGSDLQRAAAEIPQKIEVEIADLLPQLLDTMKGLGVSPAAVFAALLTQMQAEKDKLDGGA